MTAFSTSFTSSYVSSPSRCIESKRCFSVFSFLFNTNIPVYFTIQKFYFLLVYFHTSFDLIIFLVYQTVLHLICLQLITLQYHLCWFLKVVRIQYVGVLLLRFCVLSLDLSFVFQSYRFHVYVSNFEMFLTWNSITLFMPLYPLKVSDSIRQSETDLFHQIIENVYLQTVIMVVQP